MTGHMLPGESTSAALRRVTAERDELAIAVAGWVARFHAAYEALYIEEFDGDSCPDLEATIEYAIGAYRRVCESEAKAAKQIDQIRAERAEARRRRDELAYKLTKLETAFTLAKTSREYHKRRAYEARAELASAREELERLRAERSWIVARDGGRWCERCEGEVTRGQAYDVQPGTGGLVVHIHCPDLINEEKSMTGPEHYQEAERLLRLAEETIPDDEPAQAAVTARAQVHATLALAAATAMAARGVMLGTDFRTWDTACGVQPKSLKPTGPAV